MVTIRAWIQMGVERRETTIEVSYAEPGTMLDNHIEELVHDWIIHQYGWGWEGDGDEVDNGIMEGAEGTGFGAVFDSGIPNTERILRFDRLCPFCSPEFT